MSEGLPASQGFHLERVPRIFMTFGRWGLIFDQTRLLLRFLLAGVW